MTDNFLVLYLNYIIALPPFFMLIILMISYLLSYDYFPMQVLTDTSMSFLEREHVASSIAKDVIISLTVIHAFGF